MRRVILSVMFFAGLWIPQGARGELLFEGPEFQANTFTSSSQYTSSARSVSGSPDGSFVVVWQNFGFEYGYYTRVGIEGQRFDSRGNRAGGEFQASSSALYPYKNYRASTVAVHDDNRFVVVWQTYYGHVNSRRYDSAGLPETDEELQITQNAVTESPQPGLAANGDGRFVVIWQSYSSLYGRCYDAGGVSSGAVFRVDTDDYVVSQKPAAASSRDNGFVVVWQNYADYGDATSTDTSDNSIHGRRFDMFGEPLNDPFQVNTYTSNDQLRPAVAMSNDGSFLAVWDSDGSNGNDTDAQSIQGQRYDSMGVPIGPEFQINTYITGSQTRPAVATSDVGDFLVVWQSGGSHGTDSQDESIQAQRFDGSGTPLGRQLQINTYTTGAQREPSVSSRGTHDYIVAWQSAGQDGSLEGVFARLLCNDDDGNLVCDSTENSVCGDYDNDGTVTVRDALAIIRSAFNILDCDVCICAVSGGDTITAVDALAALRHSVGLEVEINCPNCGKSEASRL